MNAMPKSPPLRKSEASQRTLRSRVNHWLSEVVVPNLVNRAGRVEAAGRRLAEGDDTVVRQVRTAARARPLASLLVAAAIAYVLGRVASRPPRGRAMR